MNNRNIIPEIKRSRGYLLYDTKGRRYLDFYQDSGRAVLGHRMDGISRVMKSTVARGLTASYPSIYMKRVGRELKLLFPDAAEFRVYKNIDNLLRALSKNLGREVLFDNFVDFPSNVSEFGIWRPFTGSAVKWTGFDYFIPILPFPGDFAPAVLVVNKKDGFSEPLETLSPMICDMLIKSIALLIKQGKDGNCMDRSSFDSPVWNRTGPYLRFKLKGQEYSELFNTALKSSVLLPPESDIPGIIPCNYEKGQIKGFLDMLRLVERKLSAHQLVVPEE